MIAAVALALAIRVAYVVLQARLGLFDVSFEAGDSRLYLAIARELVAGHGMTFEGHPTAYVGPAYPIFLAALLALGAGTTAIGLVQACLGAATCAVVALLASEVTVASGRSPIIGARAAVIAAFGSAVYPHLVFWTGYVLTETLFVALVAGAFYLTVTAADRDDGGRAAAAGVVTALAALARPAYLAFGVAVVVWWLLRARERRAAGAALLFAAGLALPIAVWAVRNEVELGAPIVTTTESGFVLYAGNSREGTGGSRGYLDGRDYRTLDLPAGLSEAESDAAYQREALRQIAEDPWAAIRKWPSKLYNMWRPTYEDASTRNLLVSFATYLPVLVLGVAGAAILARAGALRASALPALFLATWVAVHVLVAGLIRYRLPAELILIVTGAVPLALWSRGRERSADPIRSGISARTTRRGSRDAI